MFIPPILRASFVFGLIGVTLISLGGCATRTADIRGEITAPKDAGLRTVAVFADPSMNPSPDADQVTAAVTTALRQQGFKVVSSESEAQLIVLPFYALLKSSQDFPASNSLYQRGSLFSDRYSPGDQLDLGVGGFALSTLTPVSAFPNEIRAGLMVTAITQKTWENLAAAPKNIPQVWRLTATTDVSGGENVDLPDSLVAAAAPYFGKDTGGKKVKQKMPPLPR